jgi:hypothetical protein
MQMLRAPAARGARNKGCYVWTPLYHIQNVISISNAFIFVQTMRCDKKTARVDDPRDLITRVYCLQARKPRDSRSRCFRPGDNLRVLIRSLGHPRGWFSVYLTTIVKKVVPFGESCPGTHTGYRIFLSHGDFASPHGDFASLSAGFLDSIFIIVLLK